MRVLLLVLTAAWALLWGALAMALMLGAGVLREVPAAAIGIAAGGVVAVPTVAIALALRRGGPLAWLAASLWPIGLVVGFPLYFPGERALALHTGLSSAAITLGRRLDPALAERIDARLPAAPAGRAPPPLAAPLPEPEIHAAAATLGPDQVALPFEGEGRTLSIPVTVEGPGGRERDVWMLFDTGATLTTLDRATLNAIGVDVPSDAPEVTVHTAAGERRTRLALVDRVWIGGMEVSGVTVSVCDPCAGEHTVGLLGLNVSGRFLATVDHRRQELLLSAQSGSEDRSLDISHWLDLGATATRWEDGRVDVTVRARNRSPRRISRAEIAIGCDETWLATLADLEPGEQDETMVSLKPGAKCEGYTVQLARARW